MLEEAEDLGLDVPKPPSNLMKKRERKLSLIPDDLIYSGKTSLLFSLEFLGDDVKVDALSRCVQTNGSIGCSPSATSFLLTKIRDPRAKGYLDWTIQYVSNGGIPSQLPFDIFENSWVLYNLIKAGWKDRPDVKAAVLGLHGLWNNDGVSWSSEFPCPDSDTTAMAFKVLWDCGYNPDPEVFSKYETDSGFKCFQFELNPSTSINVHILEALQDLSKRELPRKEEIIDKILGFLKRTVVDGERWDDKWHISTYYTTGHAILALSRIAPWMVERSVDWILRTQNPDGGWGWYGDSTSEETAYALQALMEYHSTVGHLDERTLVNAASFLSHMIGKSYERMWIAKGLYCPVNVVDSTILSSLHLFKKHCGMALLDDRKVDLMNKGTAGIFYPGGA
jgi:halimadienyl-diphosphate synthase